MSYVGLISDTHGLLRPQALEVLSGSDMIIHAGDIGAIEVIDQLKEIAPVVAIRGNVDVEPWAKAFADEETVQLDGVRIYVVHNLCDLDVDPHKSGIDVVVSGHSHKPAVENHDGILYVNPGSAGRRRFSLPIAVAKLDTNKGNASATIVELCV